MGGRSLTPPSAWAAPPRGCVRVRVYASACKPVRQTARAGGGRAPRAAPALPPHRPYGAGGPHVCPPPPPERYRTSTDSTKALSPVSDRRASAGGCTGAAGSTSMWRSTRAGWHSRRTVAYTVAYRELPTTCRTARGPAVGRAALTAAWASTQVATRSSAQKDGAAPAPYHLTIARSSAAPAAATEGEVARARGGAAARARPPLCPWVPGRGRRACVCVCVRLHGGWTTTCARVGRWSSLAGLGTRRVRSARGPRSRWRPGAGCGQRPPATSGGRWARAGGRTRTRGRRP